MARKMLPFCLVLLLVAVPAAADSAGEFEQHVFTDGEEIRLAQEDGLVALRSIRFKMSERKVHAVILAYCDEGKDQLIELDIALLDQDDGSGDLAAGTATGRSRHAFDLISARDDGFALGSLSSVGWV